AVEIVGVETFGAEVDDQILAVSDWSRGCVRRLRMALDFGNAFVSHALPEDLSGRFIESVNLPCMRRIVFDWRDVAIQTVLLFVFAATDGSDHEYFVAP